MARMGKARQITAGEAGRGAAGPGTARRGEAGQIMAGMEYTTNIEMHNYINDGAERRRQMYVEHGYCCEDGPNSNGCTQGAGPCPLLAEAKQLLWRYLDNGRHYD